MINDISRKTISSAHINTKLESPGGANYGVGNYFDKKLDLTQLRSGDQGRDLYEQLKHHNGSYRDLISKATRRNSISQGMGDSINSQSRPMSKREKSRRKRAEERSMNSRRSQSLRVPGQSSQNSSS